jgi:hypothetical protein
MNDSDKEFLSRFSLDPALESSFEDLYGSYFSYYDDEINPLDDENMPDSDDSIQEDDFLFED